MLPLDSVGLDFFVRHFRFHFRSVSVVIRKRGINLRKIEVGNFTGNRLGRHAKLVPPRDGPNSNTSSGYMGAATFNPRCPSDDRSRVNLGLDSIHSIRMALFQRGVKAELWEYETTGLLETLKALVKAEIGKAEN